jgi:hypothetical protein
VTSAVRWRRVLAGALVVLVLAAAWLAFAPLPAGSREMVFVIPPGTRAGTALGRPVDLLPAEIHLTLGVRDVLVLTNDDSAVHSVGPIVLASRQTYRIPFRRAGRFQYACSLHAAGRLTIVVTPEPPVGLERLRWRLTSARL